MREVKRFIKYILNNKKLKKKLLIFFIMAPIVNLIGVAFPFLYGKLVVFIKDKNSEMFIRIFIILLGLKLLQLILHSIVGFIFGTTNDEFSFVIKKDLFGKLINWPIKAFDEGRMGEILGKFNESSSSFTMIDNFAYIANESIKVVLTLIMMFMLNYKLSLTILIYAVISFLIIKLSKNKILELERTNRKVSDRLNSDVSESIYNIREVKTLNLKDSQYALVLNNLKNIKKRSYRMRFLYTISNKLNSLNDIISSSLIYFAGGYLVIRGELKLEYFLAFISYYMTIMAYINQLVSLNINLPRTIVKLKRTFEIIDDKLYKPENFGKKNFKEIEGNVEFKNVDFSYGNKKILNDINLSFKKNSKNAIVGKSGAGKSTIFNALIRFYDPISGKITIDGIDIKDFDEESLRKHISIIRQDPNLFSLSIKDNLKLGNKSASEEEIVEACKKAAIHEEIINLKDGYNTLVGENGVNLSGGQKQRIVIARTILKKSKIILLDEATSALDNKSQNLIKNAIDNLKNNHTVIVIAHRLSTIMDIDNITVIEDGKVKSIGNHQELLKKCEIYSNMYSFL